MCLVNPTKVVYMGFKLTLRGSIFFFGSINSFNNSKNILFTEMMKLQMEKMKGMYYKRFFNERLYM